MMAHQPGNIRIVFYNKDAGFHRHIVAGDRQNSSFCNLIETIQSNGRESLGAKVDDQVSGIVDLEGRSGRHHCGRTVLSNDGWARKLAAWRELVTLPDCRKRSFA